MNRKLEPKEWAAIKAIVTRPNTYPLSPLYGLAKSGAIMRRTPKPMSRRDKIRARVQKKNRFIETKEKCHA